MNTKDYVTLGLLFFVIFAGLPLLQRILGDLFKGKVSKKLPYHPKFILTGPEYKFYMALRPIMDARSYIICPKVGLKDMFEVNAGTKDRMKYFGKISSKHIDFLICDSSLRPVFAIELDDKSHNRADVKERDRFKDILFESAGFPLCRIPTSAAYSEAYLNSVIDLVLSPDKRNDFC